ncbi:Phosphoribosylaminoimidazole-succinocarboxamide synthase [Limihaloglobus sulfuriphilus]|uniref:Phosphoribosylaminoimidazole-succinocarboxamide synthase n=1 Tax=Limihaloglobus sulfuriphilus TaxID=1851148 RepID=A0A1Q2MG06_9BACT|nr:phosphoribosylaminoimidazolesuccinocarboxamide synthase [Limihaloglobus sulfuriphilus]AQQ71202.1 Phosphoribosylaminoimidazole-succinocarboxamide synthase [Limihaloglobus sulfuriphilus]
MARAVLETNIPGTNPIRGKVRDIYDLGDNLIIVATDRISAFDVIMKSGIPYKGAVLAQISKFWFEFFADEIENHFITDDISQYPAPFCDHGDQLEGRSMMVKKARVMPVECIIRGYITGSGWKSYQKDGEICGRKLPAGLQQCEKLPRPLFTPTTKAEIGEHDMDITIDKTVELIGEEAAEYIERKSLNIFEKAGEFALEKGIILADTKFEWGLYDGQIILVDEVLTPDSSRFWPADKYEVGRDQESFDKQFVRNYLESINFDKSGAGIELPEDVISKTSDKYIECYDRLTGLKFPK